MSGATFLTLTLERIFGTMPRNKDGSNRSAFEGLNFDTRKDFHSPESQRLRNANRKEGKVYDIGLSYVPSENSEGISDSINDTQGNDELFNDTSNSSGGGGGSSGTFELDVVDDDNTAQRASFNGSGII